LFKYKSEKKYFNKQFDVKVGKNILFFWTRVFFGVFFISLFVEVFLLCLNNPKCVFILSMSSSQVVVRGSVLDLVTKKDRSFRGRAVRRPKKKPKKKVKLNREMLDAELRRNRPAIKSGISKDDLQNMYWIGELRDFCREEGIKISGRKTKVMDRILAFFVDNTSLF